MSLFEPAPRGSDPIYRALRNEVQFAELRQQVDELWCHYQPYAPPNFAAKLSQRFLQRFWEMRLAVLLLEHGFDLEKSDDQGPDVVGRTADGQTVALEATAVEAGTGPDRVPELRYGADEARPVPNEQIALRIRNGIGEKLKQRALWIAGGEMDDRTPYVVAISVGSIAQATTNGYLPLSVRSCLGIGNFLYRVGASGDDPDDIVPVERRKLIKNNGEGVSADIFRRREFGGLSGVLVDGFRLFSVPQDGGGIEFLHNPLAENRLTSNWLPMGCEYAVENGHLSSRKHANVRDDDLRKPQ